MPEPANGGISAVILDWAGTAIDYGSMAPVRTLQRVFANRGVELADAVARRDMGIAKRDHIRKLLQEPEVASAWRELHGTASSDADAVSIYEEFLPLQTACLLDYAQVIEGVLPTVAALRERGIRIGGTTGYTRPMLEQLEQAAAAQGYAPDASLCPEDVGAGRPAPFMCYRLAILLRVYPLWTCVKIGDTVSDVEEGKNAGMWTIAVTRTGNMTGLSAAEWAGLSQPQQAEALAAAEARLRPHQPHFIVPAVADVLPSIVEIEQRLARGERP